MEVILVTGGAGFIGSNLVEALLKAGNRVVCVDNFSDNYDPHFKEENIRPFLINPLFSLHRVDICNTQALQEVFNTAKPSKVVHLAAKTDTRTSVVSPQEYVDVNITGTLNMLELSTKHKIQKFIFASSSSVYGNKNVAPYSEEASTDFPIAPYGATKKAGEILSYSYFFNFGLPVMCLRIFNAYGERNRPDLVLYKWVEQISRGEEIELSGTGTRKRDFTYIGDLVGAIELALQKDLGFEVINIGNAEPVSLVELLAVVEKTLNKKASVRSRPSTKPSVEMTHADVRKAKALLGWEPTTSLEEGVTRLVQWFREHRLK